MSTSRPRHFLAPVRANVRGEIQLGIGHLVAVFLLYAAVVAVNVVVLHGFSVTVPDRSAVVRSETGVSPLSGKSRWSSTPFCPRCGSLDPRRPPSGARLNAK